MACGTVSINSYLVIENAYTGNLNYISLDQLQGGAVNIYYGSKLRGMLIYFSESGCVLEAYFRAVMYLEGVGAWPGPEYYQASGWMALDVPTSFYHQFALPKRIKFIVEGRSSIGSFAKVYESAWLTIGVVPVPVIDPRISSVTVSPTTVEKGENVTVTARVWNDGPSGDIDVLLSCRQYSTSSPLNSAMHGQYVYNGTYKDFTETFAVLNSWPDGTVNGCAESSTGAGAPRMCKPFTVKAILPPSPRFVSVNVNPSSVQSGSTLTLTAVVINDGGPGEVDVYLSTRTTTGTVVDGTVVGTTMYAGQTYSFQDTFTIGGSYQAPGTYNGCAEFLGNSGSRQCKQFSVSPLAANLILESVTVSPTTIKPAEQLTVTARINNTGGSSGTASLKFMTYFDPIYVMDEKQIDNITVPANTYKDQKWTLVLDGKYEPRAYKACVEPVNFSGATQCAEFAVTEITCTENEFYCIGGEEFECVGGVLSPTGNSCNIASTIIALSAPTTAEIGTTMKATATVRNDTDYAGECIVTFVTETSQGSVIEEYDESIILEPQEQGQVEHPFFIDGTKYLQGPHTVCAYPFLFPTDAKCGEFSVTSVAPCNSGQTRCNTSAGVCEACQNSKWVQTDTPCATSLDCGVGPCSEDEIELFGTCVKKLYVYAAAGVIASGLLLGGYVMMSKRQVEKEMRYVERKR